MNKYTKPEMTIVYFETVDILATSGDMGGNANNLQTWGANVKAEDAKDVVDMFK